LANLRGCDGRTLIPRFQNRMGTCYL
jgi:hypothetical protein